MSAAGARKIYTSVFDGEVSVMPSQRNAQRTTNFVAGDSTLCLSGHFPNIKQGNFFSIKAYSLGTLFINIE